MTSHQTTSARRSSLSLHICKKFASPGPEDFTLDAAFTAPAGITIVFGPSGAGKTTLLECIAGLLRPDSGRVEVAGRVLFDSAQGVNVSVRRRGLAYVLQTLALFPHLTVEQNIAYGLERLSENDKRARTRLILESFHIAHLAARKREEISGGERQRVALARSLVTDPCVLLLDEPLAALDAVTKSKLIADLRVWNQAHGIPILYVTHSREEVWALGERVVALERGKVLAEGTPQQVLAAPRQEALAQLAGFENIFDAAVVGLHEDQGTMTCRIANSTVQLEVPLGRTRPGEPVRLAIRAGDILLASEAPRGLSARNVLSGRLVSLVRQGVTVIAGVDCGARFEVHLTPGAVEQLGLREGGTVWLILKTYSCHLVGVS